MPATVCCDWSDAKYQFTIISSPDQFAASAAGTAADARPRARSAAARAARGAAALGGARRAGSRPARRCRRRARSRATSGSRAASWSRPTTSSSPRATSSARQGAPTRVAETALAAAGAALGGDRRARAALRLPPRRARRRRCSPATRWLASLRRALRDAPDARLRLRRPARRAGAAAGARRLPRPRARASRATRRRVIVTSGHGAGHGAARSHARGPRRAPDRASRTPGSTPGRDQLAATGLEPVPVPVDDARAAWSTGWRRAPDAVVVTPAHQFPTGVVLAPERRAALVEWAIERDAFVLEDDYDAEYRYDRQPVGAVQGLAPDRVVYAGTVSKTLAPALRLGWLVVPERAGRRRSPRPKAADDLGTPIVEQLALADFLARGELDRHLRRTRTDLPRRAATRSSPRSPATCRTALPAGVAAGLHLVVQLPAGVDERAALAARPRARRRPARPLRALDRPAARRRCCSATGASRSRRSSPASVRSAVRCAEPEDRVVERAGLLEVAHVTRARDHHEARSRGSPPRTGGRRRAESARPRRPRSAASARRCAAACRAGRSRP